MEEILEFKEVSTSKHVPRVVMRYRGCAGTLWQQVKVTRSRLGKTKIAYWNKLKKYIKE